MKIDDEDGHRVSRVQDIWGKSIPTEAAKQWAAFPLSHPVVKARMNVRATGNAETDPYSHLKSQLREWGFATPLDSAAGTLERQLLEIGVINRCIGYDLASGAIDAARREASANGLVNLTYEQRDLEHDGLSVSGLDIVFTHQGIHHIENLEAVFDAVNDALNPGGLFHLHEFVGAD